MAEVFGRADIDVRANLRLLRDDLRQAASITTRSVGAMQRTADRATNTISRMGSGLRANMDIAHRSIGRVNTEFGHTERLATNVIAAIGGVAAARAIVNLADEYTNLSARIRLVLREGESFADVQDRIFQVAQRTRAPIAELTNLYTRLRQSIAGLGDNEALQISEVLAQTLSISGAGPSETAAFLRQISQALASGVLRGDEFNSVMENNSRFARLLADSLGVGVGELRAMAEQGRLTADVIRTGIADQAGRVNDEFANMPLTIGGAFTQIINAMQRYIGQTDSSLGASRRLAQGISALAQNFDKLADAITLVGAASIGVFAGRQISRGGDALGAAIADFNRAGQNDFRTRIDENMVRVDRINGAIETIHNARLATSARLNELYREAENLQREMGAIRQQIGDEANQSASRNPFGRVTVPSAGARRAGPAVGDGEFEERLSATQRLARAEAELAGIESSRVVLANQMAGMDARLAEQNRNLAVAVREVDRGMARGATTARLFAGAMGVARGVVGSLVSFLGGPWGVALSAAMVALVLFRSETERAAKAQQGLVDAYSVIADSVPAFEGAASEIGEVADQTRLVGEESDRASDAIGRLNGLALDAADAARIQANATRILAEERRKDRNETIRQAIAEREHANARLRSRILFREARPDSRPEVQARIDALQVADRVELAQTQQDIRQLSDALALRESGLLTDPEGGVGGGGGGGGGSGTARGRDLAELRMQAELSLARLRNEQQRVAQLEDALEIERRIDAYTKAGLSAAGARAEAEREVSAERAAIIETQRESIQLSAIQFQADLERARGNVIVAESLERELDIRQRIKALMSDGVEEEQATRIAAARAEELRQAQALERARQIAIRRLEFLREIAEAEGNTDRVRDISAQIDQIRRTDDLRANGFTEAEANKAAGAEVSALLSAEARGRLREGFVSALLAAATDNNWRDAMARSLQQAAERGFTRAIDLIYDALQGALSGSRGGGGIFSSILGAIMGGGGGFGGGLSTPPSGIPIPGKANGGSIKPFTAYRGAELGTEPIFLTNKPGHVVTNREMRAAMGAGSGGGGGRVQIFHIDARGADASEAKIRIAAMQGAAEGERRALASMGRMLREGQSS